MTLAVPSPSVLAALLYLTLLAGVAARAQAQSTRPLACAVEPLSGQPGPDATCQAVGKSLHRPIERVDDARKVSAGDSLQVIGDDVRWIVIWLRDGRVRAWTRVSKTAAQGHELEMLTRAVRALSVTRIAQNESCVRVQPNGGRAMRGFDLAYPWAVLKQCKARQTEIADPWVEL